MARIFVNGMRFEVESRGEPAGPVVLLVMGLGMQLTAWPDELVRVVPSPETIHIVVCGDPNRNRVMVLWGGYVNPVTKKIDLLSQ